MHLVVLQLVLYFAAFCDTGIIQWFQAQRQVAEWAPNSPNVVEQLRPFEKGYALPTESAATYRRKGNSSHAKTRILFVDYLSVTWSFSPRTASWTTITTTPSAEDALSRLRKKTITNLCGTKVVAFGGYQEESDASDPQNVLSNKAKTALFNGETEEWQFFLHEESPPNRYGHKALAHHSKQSTCECKESLFVYGGHDTPYNKTFLEDFWEFRCIDERSMNYTWIQIDTSLWPLQSLANRTAFSADNQTIYWLTHNSQELWTFDVATKNWSSKVNDSDCTYHANATFEQDIAYIENQGLLIFQVNDGLLGVYDVKKNRFQCVSIQRENLNEHIPAKIMQLEDKIIFLSLTKQSNDRVGLWEAKTNKLLQILRGNFSDSRLHFNITAFVEKYPIFDWDARLFSFSDTVSFLMLEKNQKVQMWRFERDYLRWTLYDPDQIPGTRKAQHRSLEKTAFTATIRNIVAFFGSNNSYSSTGSDHLWMSKQTLENG